MDSLNAFHVLYNDDEDDVNQPTGAIMSVCGKMVDSDAVEYAELVPTMFLCAAICAYRAGMTPADYVEYIHEIKLTEGNFGHA